MRTDKFNLKIKKIMNEKIKRKLIKFIFPWRNCFILFNLSNRAKKNQVNLNYWDDTDNLGDTLSPVIVNYMLSLRDVSYDKKISKRKHLYAVGSVLTAGIQDATVWGSGILNAKLAYRLENRKFDFRAVRGPITRAILMDYGYRVPEVYGDPAIILSEIYAPINSQKVCKYGLIVHKDYDMSNMQGDIDRFEIKKIDICTSDYRKFVDDLISVELIISSSLHGIILSETYGIPAILLKPQIDIVKYSDYYYSTGRLDFPVAMTLEEAVNTVPVKLPDLEKMRVDLKRVFPYDLYE